MRADIAVLGAGPAGLAAAAAAHRAGARVTLVDSAPRVGGQYWRHREGTEPTPSVRDVPVDFRSGHAIWHVERTAAGFTTHTSRGEIRSRTVVVATGAYDRQLPFPGWTLPGVFTAGGAQALLKGHGVVVGDRIVVAGTGPFLLPVAAGLAEAGARVLGVFEAGSPLGFARRPAAVLRNLDKLAEGAAYLKVLRRHRVPFHTGQTVVAAHGDDEVRAVTVASLDRTWHVVAEREVECDAVAVGYGFTPQLELPLQLGCDTHLDVDGGLVATADEWQRASVPHVYLAGEVCGVGGAPLSIVEGEVAGLHAAGATPDRRLLRRRSRLRAFAAAMHRTYPVRPGWQTWLAEDTVVCRCEEVPVAEIRRAVEDLGATDPRAVKLLVRPGMGLCQGRVCGFATACLVARKVTASDLLGLSARPIAQPVTLGGLAQQHVEVPVPSAAHHEPSPSQPHPRGTGRNPAIGTRPTQRYQPKATPREKPGEAGRPWHGVLVATALQFDASLAVDHDRYAEHVAWLAAQGCHGVTPNGSLGEYQTLTPEERARVVTTAVEAAPEGFTVMPGVAAYGAAESRRWAEQAAEVGCQAVMLLPPNAYRADERAVLAHYREVARAGLPVVAYNNPIDTKVDLVPELLAELYQEGLIVAVKEFTGDVRRPYRINELAPGLDVLCGADDVALELAVAGAPGWIAGYPNALPESTVELWKAASAGDLATALPLYRLLHPLLRWDSRTEFVQSIKLSMDLAGRYGGPCRQPRVPLTPEHEAAVRQATERALAEGLS